MKYLGIDYGDKRIGIAVSDGEGKIAFPRETLLNEGKKTLQAIKKILKKEAVDHIVVGLPLGEGGKDTAQTQITRKFIKLLETEVSLPVSEQNELLTSKIAEESSPKKAADASAAALILQSYLDKLH